MKERIVITAMLFLLASCKKENATPVLGLTDQADTAAVAIKQGAFQNGPYGTVTGKAVLYRNNDGSFDILLESFTSSNGPDLYVYLSREIMPVDFIQLDRLRSVTGSQLYRIPGSPDFAQYKYVNIHCRQYNHLFGYALLQ